MNYVLWPVGRGFAKVSRSDIDLVAGHSWYLSKGYARTMTGQRQVYMHRLIVGRDADGKVVDHRSGDKLDNRRENLRACSLAENARSTRKREGAHPYKGVYFRPHMGKWRAQIRADRKIHRLGHFSSPEDAARAYNEAAARLHGEFARLNVIPAKAA